MKKYTGPRTHSMRHNPQRTVRLEPPLPSDPTRFVGKCLAVTSLNPSPERITRQLLCLQSWRDIGLPLTVVNTAKEIDQLSVFQDLAAFHPCEDLLDEFDRPTQFVNSLIDVGIESGLPFMLINSDIEIHGHCRHISEALELPEQLTIGVRHNHPEGNRNRAVIEPCGMDCFLMTPAMARTIPRLRLGIGKPMWDYWIPEHFRRQGCKFNWITAPFFFHEQHELGWTQSELSQLGKTFLDHYGLDVVRTNLVRMRDAFNG